VTPSRAVTRCDYSALSCTLSIHLKTEVETFVESPERLGKYPLLSIIGTGSMAVVYKSIDPDIGRAVALKTIRRELLDDEIENYPARLRIEAEAGAALVHPCIVRTYEYGEADGYAFIAMEYVEGHSLRDCFESQVRFNTDQAINIISQLLKALQYAHLHGVWHRDVKPANILLVTDGLIKVGDFGIARVESLNLAQTDSIMGTPGFIAPEMYLGEAFDQRIDLFAAGVVFYQLLTGVAPFVGTPEKIMFKVCYETALPASVVARQSSLRPLDAVVLKALARSPEDRFASAAEFLEALALAQAGGPVATDQTVIVARRLLQPGGSASVNETLLVPRRAKPDTAEYTLIRPLPTEDFDPLTEPFPPPPVLEPIAEAPAASPPRAVNTQTFEPQSFVARVLDTPPVNTPPVDPPSVGPHPIDTLSLAPTWTEAELTQIEKNLARFVGPIAGIWVRSGARETSDLVALIQCLAMKFSDAADRDAFLRGFGVTPTFSSAPNHSGAGAKARDTSANGGVGVPLTPEYIERAARLLTVHLGPIATVLAKRAAQPGSSQEQFVDTLCTHLRDDGERERFLRTLA
jgi:eukaryotic-like serine/threonine-protein kinase